MIRLDKFLVHVNAGTRSTVKPLIKHGRVAINGAVVKSPDFKFDEKTASVTLDGKPLVYEEYVYYMLNKPAGVVSACDDAREKTVLDFFKNEPCIDLFPVGRLDKDTVGLLLITNDGALSHRLLAPGKHVDKKYFVRLRTPLKTGDKELLEAGVDIGDDTPTHPAGLTETDNPSEVFLTITEGRFHQVKRMFEAVGNEVVYLKRVSMGKLMLDEALPEGAFKKLTIEEIE